jgi:hypothetical protein
MTCVFLDSQELPKLCILFSFEEDSMDESNRIAAQLHSELERRGVKLPGESALYSLPWALDELERLAMERYITALKANA